MSTHHPYRLSASRAAKLCQELEGGLSIPSRSPEQGLGVRGAGGGGGCSWRNSSSVAVVLFQSPLCIVLNRCFFARRGTH